MLMKNRREPWVAVLGTGTEIKTEDYDAYINEYGRGVNIELRIPRILRSKWFVCKPSIHLAAKREDAWYDVKIPARLISLSLPSLRRNRLCPSCASLSVRSSSYLDQLSVSPSSVLQNYRTVMTRCALHIRVNVFSDTCRTII